MAADAYQTEYQAELCREPLKQRLRQFRYAIRKIVRRRELSRYEQYIVSVHAFVRHPTHTAVIGVPGSKTISFARLPAIHSGRFRSPTFQSSGPITTCTRKYIFTHRMNSPR